MFDPFKGMSQDAVKALAGREKISVGAHNLTMRLSETGYTGAVAGSAAAGGVIGGVSGSMSYDGTFMGGAVSGVMAGAALGGAGRYASSLYSKGATISNQHAVGEAFRYSHIKTGWNGTPVVTPPAATAAAAPTPTVAPPRPPASSVVSPPPVPAPTPQQVPRSQGGPRILQRARNKLSSWRSKN